MARVVVLEVQSPEPWHGAKPTPRDAFQDITLDISYDAPSLSTRLSEVGTST